MLRFRIQIITLFLAVVSFITVSVRGWQTGTSTPRHTNVDGARIVAADREPGNWMTHGRTYSEQRFSPLKDINDRNAGELGLAWYYDLDTNRGQEATPIIVDGVMYFTSAWSKVSQAGRPR